MSAWCFFQIPKRPLVTAFPDLFRAEEFDSGGGLWAFWCENGVPSSGPAVPQAWLATSVFFTVFVPFPTDTEIPKQNSNGVTLHDMTVHS